MHCVTLFEIFLGICSRKGIRDVAKCHFHCYGSMWGQIMYLFMVSHVLCKVELKVFQK